MLESKWLKKSSAKKDLEVLLEEKMNESATNVSICLRLHQEIIPSRSGKVIIPLYSALVEGTSEMLYSGLGSTVLEKCGLGMSPGKGHED